MKLKYLSADENYTGRPHDASILKKLEILYKGYDEVNLNLIDFVNYNNLSMILCNNFSIEELELYNYDELLDDDIINFKAELEYEFINCISKDYNSYEWESLEYYLPFELEDLSLNEVINLYNLRTLDSIREFIDDELDEAIDDYCRDVFHEGLEVYQYFIIDDVDMWENYTNYPIFYHHELDLYLVGITHWGMSWKFFNTKFKYREYIRWSKILLKFLLYYLW